MDVSKIGAIFDAIDDDTGEHTARGPLLFALVACLLCLPRGGLRPAANFLASALTE